MWCSNGAASSNALVKDGKARLRNDGDETCSVALSFIGATGDNVMIRFPRKRCLSVSTTRAI
jgi:hypothetical protein